MRLIDAEAFDIFLEKTIGLFIQKQTEQSYNDLLKEYKTGYALGVLLGVQDSLKSQPTIEAKPVVHAHWNDDGRCTNCGGHAPFFAWTDEWFGTKFCPHCGAQIHKSISCNHEDDNHIAEDGKKGIKIPVISMEDVLKFAKEMEK